MKSVVTAFAALVLLSLITPPTAEAQPPRRPFLFKDARGELAQARARGESEVVLVMAAMPGRNARLAAAIEGMGGRIGFRFDEVDYLRAWVPLDRVEELADHPDIHSVDVSITNRSRSFGLAGGDALSPARPLPSADTIWPPVLGDQPLSNRYSPLGDMRALEWREQNPTWDGRGVTVAMIDMLPDMLLPELQTARNLDGEEVPKIAVYRNALDPEIEDNGWWLDMDDMVEASGGGFSYRDSAYTAPRDGVFRIALFDEVRADTMGVYGSSLERDVNRDGNPEGSSRLFAVLWDEGSGDLWVDTDQDLDFTDETLMGDYAERPGFGVFGTRRSSHGGARIGGVRGADRPGAGPRGAEPGDRVARDAGGRRGAGEPGRRGALRGGSRRERGWRAWARADRRTARPRRRSRPRVTRMWMSSTSSRVRTSRATTCCATAASSRR